MGEERGHYREALGPRDRLCACVLGFKLRRQHHILLGEFLHLSELLHLENGDNERTDLCRVFEGGDGLMPLSILHTSAAFRLGCNKQTATKLTTNR